MLHVVIGDFRGSPEAQKYRKAGNHTAIENDERSIAGLIAIRWLLPVHRHQEFPRHVPRICTRVNLTATCTSIVEETPLGTQNVYRESSDAR